MDITSKIPSRALSFGPKDAVVSMTFRPMTSLDDDIAIQSAVKWFGELVQSTEVQAEFGMPVSDIDQIMLEIQAAMDDVKSYSRFLYAVALAVRIVTSLEGLTLDGVVTPRSRRTFAVLFRDKTIMDKFLTKATLPFHAVAAAGNA